MLPRSCRLCIAIFAGAVRISAGRWKARLPAFGLRERDVRNGPLSVLALESEDVATLTESVTNCIMALSLSDGDLVRAVAIHIRIHQGHSRNH